MIGGGITGCGVALDAASRGLSVGLVEREDFASGTSGQVLATDSRRRALPRAARARAGARVATRARDHPAPRAAPRCGRCRSTCRDPTLAFRAAFTIYDLLAIGVNVARHRRVDAEELDRVAPGLEHRGGGFVYHECATDDARLTLEIARAAAEHGALVANHARVEGLLGDGRVTGAIVRDELSGEAAEIRAKTTVNATGVWSEQLQSLATDSPRRQVTSKGIHLVFRPGAVRAPHGAARPVGRGRPPLRVRDPVGGPLLRRHDRHCVRGRSRSAGGRADRRRLRPRCGRTVVPRRERAVRGRLVGRPPAAGARRRRADRRPLASPSDLRGAGRLAHRDRRQAHDLSRDGRGRRGSPRAAHEEPHSQACRSG